MRVTPTAASDTQATSCPVAMKRAVSPLAKCPCAPMDPLWITDTVLARQYSSMVRAEVLSTLASISAGKMHSAVTFLPRTVVNDRALAFLSPE